MTNAPGPEHERSHGEYIRPGFGFGDLVLWTTAPDQQLRAVVVTTPGEVAQALHVAVIIDEAESNEMLGMPGTAKPEDLDKLNEPAWSKDKTITAFERGGWVTDSIRQSLEAEAAKPRYLPE